MADQAETQHTGDVQRLRLQRMSWGFLHQLGVLVIVVALSLAGILPAARALEFLVASLGINLLFLALLKSGVNLRFRDPSMTAAQILLPVLPAIYVMYFVTEPQARTAFLLMATGACSSACSPWIGSAC